MEILQGTPPSEPKVRVDFLKGFKSDIMNWEDPISATARHGGHRTTLYGYRHPGKSLDFLPEYRERAREVFCNPGQYQKPEIPRVACAHSLGAFLLMELLTEDETAAAIAEKYDGIVTFNGFLGSQYTNIPFRKHYARLFQDSTVGTTWIERRFSSVSNDYNIHELPTHAQGLMLDKEANALIEKICDQGGFSKALGNMPITFVIGKYDPVCDNESIRKVANIIDEDPVEFNVNHNAMEYPRVQEFFVAHCKELAMFAQNKLQRRSAFEDIVLTA